MIDTNKSNNVIDFEKAILRKRKRQQMTKPQFYPKNSRPKLSHPLPDKLDWVRWINILFFLSVFYFLVGQCHLQT